MITYRFSTFDKTEFFNNLIQNRSDKVEKKEE